MCIKYIKSANARPNFFAAKENCTENGGSLYKINSKEKKFLLYEIMKTSECTEFMFHYFALKIQY